MNGPFQVAQTGGAATSSTTETPVRIYKLTKPLTDQAVIVNLGYDQKVQVDFSSIADEKITLVHVGEKLIILFDNQSTVTVEPFFDSRNDPRQNITIEMAPGRDISVTEFASLFPISTDTSVLPASDNGGNSNGNAHASGAHFTPADVDPLPPVPTNVLAPQEELPTWTVELPTGFVLQQEVLPAGPTIAAGLVPGLLVDESFLTVATNGVAGSGQAPAGSTVATGLVPFTIDAPAGQQSLTLALNINNPTTNLIDSATGQVVTLIQKGSAEVDGVVAISGVQTSVFTLTVDAAGRLTLTDLRAVHEDTPGNFNEGIILAAGLVSLTATVTDVNNNTASASVDVGPHLTFLDDGPVASTVAGTTDTLVLDESRPEGTDSTVHTDPLGLATVTANFSDNFTGGIYGADGAGSTVYKLVLTGSNVASGLFALDVADTTAGDGDGIGQGAPIVLNQSGDIITGSANGTTYFTISIDESTGVVTFTQVNSIWHSDPNNPDDAATLTTAAGLLQLVQTLTDADGDAVSTPLDLGTGVFTIQDSGPVAGRVIATTELVLDESRPEGNDTTVHTDPLGLATVSANFSGDFTGGGFGSDGPGSGLFKLVLTGSDVASGLFALDATDTTAGDGDGIGQGPQIVLNQSGDVITGSVGPTTYFTISIDESTGVVTFTQVSNIWHSDPTNPDDAATLTLANADDLRLVQILTDADGDTAPASLNLGTGVFTIQDSGPTASTLVGTADTLVLDETRPEGTDTAGGTTPTGLATVTANFSDNFTAANYGSDGAGSTVYTLKLTGSNVASGLFALDTTDTTTGDGDGIGQGAPIVLNQSGDTITGTANGTTYFTITINEGTGVVTFTQVSNIWHSDPTNPDDAATLTAAAGLLQLVQTITDADGDSVNTPLDLGTGVFTIQDSGPTAGTLVGTADTLVLDETRPVGTDTAGGTTPTGLATITANFSDNFTAANYGSDGAGSTVYTLKLTGSNVASGLFALDTTDTTTGDGDGIGQGAPIVLNQSGDTITGTANGTTYFMITINEGTGVVTFTQVSNIWHSDPTNPDDAATLTLANADDLRLVQILTDADGDTAPASLNLGTGVFTIQDSGPTASTLVGTADTLVLDETRPVGTDSTVHTDPLGLATVTANFSDNFTGGIYGADGAGSTVYTLKLTGSNVASGLFALDPADTTAGDGDGIGQGAPIVLNQSGDIITGSANGTTYFTISIDESTGVVTFTQVNSIWHSDPNNPDDAATLTAAAGVLQLVQTITDADGDAVNTPLDLGTGVFTIQDSGPVAGRVIATTELVLDESRPEGNDTTVHTDPLGLATVSANFSGDFTGGGFGSDGPGSGLFKLVLTGSDVASGLFALDATDTTAGDGDGIGQGAPIVLNQSGDVITGSVGPTTYFTISIDESTGVVTFTQVSNIWHSDPTNPDDAATLTLANADDLRLVQILTDADGDTAPASLNLGTGVFTIQDSGPTASTLVGTADTLVLDESAVGTDTTVHTDPLGLATVTANFSDNFTGGSFGTDGAGSTVYTLKLTGSNVASGLFALDPADKSAVDGDGIGQGAPIVLNQSGDIITGSVGLTTYFTITINETTGVVTFTQVANIWHSNTTNPDDAATLTAAAGVLQLVQTITDADGDAVNTPLDLGTGVFTIQDSGPTASTLVGTADTLVLDESAVGTDTTVHTDPLGLATVTANFSDNFTGGSFGTDGAGSTVYTLKLTGSNVASGLFALDPADKSAVDGDGIGQGAPIVLNQSGDIITGSVGLTTYFTITINETTGVVTFTQVANIWHSNTTNPDDAATLTAAAGVLQLVQTITDADGDAVNTPLDLGTGVFTIQDSGPTASTLVGTADTLVLDESAVGTDTTVHTDPLGLATVTANFSDNFTGGSFGTDGAGSTVYTLKLTGSNVASGLFALDPADKSAVDGDGIGQGAPIVLNQSGDIITGSVGLTTYFTITINETTGVVTFTQVANIWHSNTTNPDDAATLTAAAGVLQLVQTITDADGDAVNTPLDLGTGVFTIQDSGPTASTLVGTADTLVLDESAVGTDTTVHTDPLGLATVTANFSDNFTGGSFGTDGAGSTVYTLKLTGSNVASGLFALDPADKSAVDGDGIGQGAPIVLNQSGDIITGSVGLTTYFTITINETTGVVTFTQVANIWHSNTTNPDDAATLTAAAGVLQLVQTITDADGDAVNTPLDLGTGVFTIQDSGPTASTLVGTADTLVLDESPVPPNGDGIVSATGDFSANFAAVNYGTDGPGSTSYKLVLSAGGIASGLFALDPADVLDVGGDGDGIGKGASILLYVSADGLTITGSTAASAGLIDPTNTYFTITVDNNPLSTTFGDVTFAQTHNIWHSDTSNPDDAATLTTTAATNVQLVQTVTDADGDSASAALNLGANVFTIQDDGPTNIIPSMAVLTNGTGAIATARLDVDTNTDNNYGTDGGTVRFSTSLNGPTSLTSGGKTIFDSVSADGHTLTGYVDNNNNGVFDAGDGKIYTVTLNVATLSDTYTVQMFGTVDAVTVVDFNSGGFNFVGGNSSWAGFTKPAVNPSPDLLMTPAINHQDAGTINTNANEGGVSGGNSVGGTANTAETFRIDFVTDLTGDPADSGAGNYANSANRDFTFAGHYTTNGASADFTNTSGSTVNIKAFDDDTTIANTNNIVGDGTPDKLTGMVIQFAGGSSGLIDLTQPLQPSYSVGGHTFFITPNADGVSFDVHSVVGGSTGTTTIAVFTADGFNSVEYTWVNDPVFNDTFKIGNFGAAIPTTNPVDFSVPVQVVDGDGDTASGSLNINLLSAINTLDHSAPADPGGNFTVTVAQPNIIGSGFDDTLNGDGAANILYGGSGIDTLNGLGGNDTLIGNADGDTLNGGAGNDTFVLQLNSSQHDTISDFLPGTDQIIANIGQGHTIPTAAPVDPTNFHTGDQTLPATWSNGTGNEFVYNSGSGQLWYSANGTGTDQIELAQLSTGLSMTAANIHTI